MATLDQFPEDFAARVFVCPLSGCWLWQGMFHNRYPFFHHKKSLTPYLGKVERLAHRFAWAYPNGPIPLEHDVHHVCLITRCVNPAHAVVLSHEDHVVLHRWLRLLRIERTQTSLEITPPQHLTRRGQGAILNGPGALRTCTPPAVTLAPADQWEQPELFT